MQDRMFAVIRKEVIRQEENIIHLAQGSNEQARKEQHMHKEGRNDT